jgi:putative protein-disulfide isomerase
MKQTETKNAMACDPVTGLCEIPQQPETGEVVTPAQHTTQKPVKLTYFTDPICSSCWGIEPQLRKLKIEYGDSLDIEYRMGGLLKSWESYGGRDVNGPASVAQHWNEASEHYQMPIDGEVWLEDPLDSSYPPSIAFKAAQLQDEKKADAFLRRLKEMVFLEKKNITKWEHLEEAARESGLDVTKFKQDYEGRAKLSFEDDLAMARALGVRGFPTIYFSDEEGNRLLVYGSKPYASYEDALKRIYPEAKKNNYTRDSLELFSIYPTMTVREFAELKDIDLTDASAELETLTEKKQIERKMFRYGDLVLYHKTKG